MQTQGQNPKRPFLGENKDSLLDCRQWSLLTSTRRFYVVAPPGYQLYVVHSWGSHQCFKIMAGDKHIDSWWHTGKGHDFIFPLKSFVLPHHTFEVLVEISMKYAPDILVDYTASAQPLERIKLRETGHNALLSMIKELKQIKINQPKPMLMEEFLHTLPKGLQAFCGGKLVTVANGAEGCSAFPDRLSFGSWHIERGSSNQDIYEIAVQIDDYVTTPSYRARYGDVVVCNAMGAMFEMHNYINGKIDNSIPGPLDYYDLDDVGFEELDDIDDAPPRWSRGL